MKLLLEKVTCSDFQLKPDPQGHHAVHGDDQSDVRGGRPRSCSRAAERDAFERVSSEPHHTGFLSLLLPSDPHFPTLIIHLSFFCLVFGTASARYFLSVILETIERKFGKTEAKFIVEEIFKNIPDSTVL